jgi:hypothetical protein
VSSTARTAVENADGKRGRLKKVEWVGGRLRVQSCRCRFGPMRSVSHLGIIMAMWGHEHDVFWTFGSVSLPQGDVTSIVLVGMGVAMDMDIGDGRQESRSMRMKCVFDMNMGRWGSCSCRQRGRII